MQRVAIALEELDVYSIIVLSIVFAILGKLIDYVDSASDRWAKRLTLGAFLALICVRVFLDRGVNFDAMVSTSLRSALMSAFVYSTCRVLLRVALNSAQFLFNAPVAILRKYSSRLRQYCRRRQTLREEEHRQKELQYKQQLDAPVREQAMLDAQTESNRKLDDQLLREDIRSRTELHFTLVAPEVGERFTKAMFEHYVSQYMHDRVPVERVEERSRNVIEIMEKHRAVVTVPSTKSVELLVAWLLSETQRIQSLPLEETLKQQLRLHLHRRYELLAEQYFGDMKP